MHIINGLIGSINLQELVIEACAMRGSHEWDSRDQEDELRRYEICFGGGNVCYLISFRAEFTLFYSEILRG